MYYLKVETNIRRNEESILPCWMKMKYSSAEEIGIEMTKKTESMYQTTEIQKPAERVQHMNPHASF